MPCFSLIKISLSHSLSWIHEWSSMKLDITYNIFVVAQVLMVDITDLYMVKEHLINIEIFTDFFFQDIEIEDNGTDLGEGSLSSYLVNKDLKIFLTFLYKEKHPSLLFEKHNIRYLNLKYFWKTRVSLLNKVSHLMPYLTLVWEVVIAEPSRTS